MKSKMLVESIKIEKLNERGYGVGFYENKEIWVLNALPGELVRVMVFKRKKDILFATAEEILEKSPFRLPAQEDHFLACSPWQILTFEKENEAKKALIQDFNSEFEVSLPSFEVASKPLDNTDPKLYGYRNKVEYSFYGHDDESLEFAFFKREGNKGKYPHKGCDLANDRMNMVANQILEVLNDKNIVAKKLKTLLIRYSIFEDKVVAGLFVKDDKINLKEEDFGDIFENGEDSFCLIFSNPKSPASVVDEIQVQIGDSSLVEKVLGINLKYDFTGFFQVNVPMFEVAVTKIKSYLDKITQELGKKPNIIDLYAGVGTIGLALADSTSKVLGIEIFPGTKQKALENAKLNNIENFEFEEIAAENATEMLGNTEVLIVDPPRIGLHQKVLDKIVETKPKYIIYLSCNPHTQAQNMGFLKDFYNIEEFEAYNFYPRTPHVEALAILKLK
jgi:23S rRNA (uracil1939-C5)-methyltransferase